MSDVITLNHLTTEIASSMGKELDEPFKLMLADKIDHWRGRLIRNSLQEKPQEAVHFMQTIYVPMSKQDPIDCLKTPLCLVLRSTTPLPKPLRYTPSLYHYVGAIDGKHAFRPIGVGMTNYIRAGKYSGRAVMYEQVNKHIIIDDGTGNMEIPLVRVDAVWDKPTAAMAYNCASGNGNCDQWNEEYPVTQDIAQMIVQSIRQVDFGQVPTTTASNKEVDVNPQNLEHAPDGR